MKRGGWKHNQETNTKIAATRRAQLSDPAERAKISEATKAAMSDPAVRQRIRDGILSASGAVDELRALRAVWRSTRATVRTRFLAELLEPACRADREAIRHELAGYCMGGKAGHWLGFKQADPARSG